MSGNEKHAHFFVTDFRLGLFIFEMAKFVKLNSRINGTFSTAIATPQLHHDILKLSSKAVWQPASTLFFEPGPPNFSR